MTTFTNYSQTIGTSPVQIYPQLPAATSFLRIWNVSATGGPTIWLSRFTQTPAANAPGCYPLIPGNFEEFIVNSSGTMGPPLNQLWAIATASGAELTVEAGI
jgi:hypothetical protein